MRERSRAAIVAPFSGPRRAWGELLQRAAARRDDVDWIEIDDEGRAELGAVCARRAIEAGAVAVAGHFNSGGAARALPEYAAAGVACLLPLATAPGLTALAPGLVLRHCPTDDQQAHALVAALGGEASVGRGGNVARGGGTTSGGGAGGGSAGGGADGGHAGDAVAAGRGGDAGGAVAVLDDASPYGVGLAALIEAAGATRVDLAAAARWRGGLVVSGVHRAAADLARELHAAGCAARLAFVDDCDVDEFAELAGDAAHGALVAGFPGGGQACVDAMVDALAEALTSAPAFRGGVLVDAIRASSPVSYDDRGERIGAAWDVRAIGTVAGRATPGLGLAQAVRAPREELA